ncbi:MAG: response regulator [candidate division KSB1 bacterium]|nr:response regulator [candidate division KSB1 bacterium]MDZ7276420.1 response regulator [candidate division KSB1 bacterium]MDZ7288090.1 response regulator [candidate division KSB1 bacterium]MDZ7300191.1 response regulator [candidate division KSB1 bacterium]MDZ7305762.1 response regulator [candidate division KSB1 bacterium]
MDRKRILINEKEPREVADLRKALVATGYDVRMAESSAQTLELIASFKPNLLISEVRMPVMDGPHLLQEVRNRPATRALLFVMIGKLRTVEERVGILKLPIDDYLQKPLDIDEAVVRIDNLIKEIELLSASSQPRWRGFNGHLSEMNLVDLLQTIEVGKKTCVLKLRAHEKEGQVFVTEGQVIDAELGGLEARRALLRMFTWSEGTFQVELRPHERTRMLTIANRDLISEGLTRQHRWRQLTAQLPPLHTQVMLAPSPAPAANEEEQALFKLLENGVAKRLLDLVEENSADDLRTLTVCKKLFERGAIQAVQVPSASQNGESTQWLKRLQDEGQTRSASPVDALFKAIVKPVANATVPHERRRADRRQQAGRRQYDRRNGLVRKLYLNKSELLMIRAKLSH